MGIKIFNLDLLNAYLGGEQILGIYTNGYKLWPSIIVSCYANGYWIDEYQWTDNTSWTD